MTQNELIATIPQVGFAFHRIESALTLLVQNLSDLSSLAAKTERIDTLFSGAPISHMCVLTFCFDFEFCVGCTSCTAEVRSRAVVLLLPCVFVLPSALAWRLHYLQAVCPCRHGGLMPLRGVGFRSRPELRLLPRSAAGDTGSQREAHRAGVHRRG